MTDLEKLDEAMARAACAAQLGPYAWKSFSDILRKEWLESAAAHRAVLLSHLDAEGWQVVPKVATDIMLVAGHNVPLTPKGDGTLLFRQLQRLNHQFGAMLAAAPPFGGSND